MSTEMSITEAAQHVGFTRQAIYVAIIKKRLKAQRKAPKTSFVGNLVWRWVITMDDLIEYQKNKYCRSKSMYQGRLRFDKSRGEYSINEAAAYLKAPVQKIYYLARIGFLPSKKKDSSWVLQKEDLDRLRDKIVEKESSKMEEIVEKNDTQK